MSKIMESESMWEPVQSETLSWHIVTQIRNALFSGQLVSGDFLGSESILSSRFGVSRMAARDALRTLEAVGIVEIRKGVKGGAWIARGNPGRFADALAIQLQLIGVRNDELFDAQMAVEATSAELAAKVSTPEDHQRLKDILTELMSLKNDPVKFTEQSLQFHEAVVEISGNRVLIAQFRALRLIIEPLLTPNTTPAIIEKVTKSHKALLAAIIERDVDQARELMRSRIKSIRQHFLSGASTKSEAIN